MKGSRVFHSWMGLSCLPCSPSLCHHRGLGPVLPVETFFRQIMNSLENSYQGLSREHRREKKTPPSSTNSTKPFPRTLMNPACAQYLPSLLINSASARLPRGNTLISLVSSTAFSLLHFPSQSDSTYLILGWGGFIFYC